MKHSLLIWVAAIVLTSCGGGSGNSGGGSFQPPPPAGPTPAEELAASLDGLALGEFYEESFKALLLRDPERVIALGLAQRFALDEVALTSLADAYVRETQDMYRVVYGALLDFDRDSLAASERISFDVYEWFLKDTVDAEPFIYYGFPATYSLFGIPRDTQQFFSSIHPLETEADAEGYITRLNLVRAKFDQLREHLQRQRDAGIIEPQLTLEIARSQVNEIAQSSAESSLFYTTFRDKVTAIAALTDAERDALGERALDAIRTNVIPAYRDLNAALTTLASAAPGSIGVGQYPDGAAFYANRLAHHTTTALTPAEVHQLGLTELRRIHAEMRLIFDQLGYPQNETLETSYERVSQEGGIIPAADALATFEDLIVFASENVGQAFDIFPSADVVVIADDFGGFYIEPALDGTRPGAFFAGTTSALPYYDMPSLAFHEAIPGHHTQIAIAQDLDLPLFRKIVRSTAYVEGWALYAERLAYELGWYDGDPYGNLGRLQFEALRAARLVIDTGIHEFGWSFDQATQFNNENVGVSIGASQQAAARYSVTPGQATAYMIGMLKILELRQRAMDELGSQFSLVDFHRAVIGNGAMPLDVLERVVGDSLLRVVGDSLLN